MKTESTFEIPCVCGTVVSSHERENQCPQCGRELQVEWGDLPAGGKTETKEQGAGEQAALFETRREAF